MPQVTFDPAPEALLPATPLGRATVLRPTPHGAPDAAPWAPPPAPTEAVGIACAALDALLAAALPIVLHLLLAGRLPSAAAQGAIALAVVLVLLLGTVRGHYRQPLLSEAPLVVRVSLSTSSLALGLATFATMLFGAHHGLSPVWAGAGLAGTPAALAGARLLLVRLLLRDRRRRFAPRTVVIGGGAHGVRLLARLQQDGGRGLRLLGYADDRATRLAAGAAPVPFLGSVENAFRLLRAGAVDLVIVALPWSAEDRVLGLLRRLSDYPVQVRLAPDLIQYHVPRHASTEIAGLRLLHLFDRPISGAASLVKRAEDLLIGVPCLLALALPMLLIALAIRLETPGPALFRQRRTGFNGCEFEMLKFRTMHLQPPAGPLLQTVRGDPRVTGVGAILRRASLDELPQLVNVLRGEMSLVGPRPHAPGTRAGGRPFEQVAASYAARHRVRPGLTGLAQVRGLRGETETEAKLLRRVESDLEYVENWSIWLDLLILFRTAAAVLSMRNAY